MASSCWDQGFEGQRILLMNRFCHFCLSSNTRPAAWGHRTQDTGHRTQDVKRSGEERQMLQTTDRRSDVDIEASPPCPGGTRASHRSSSQTAPPSHCHWRPPSRLDRRTREHLLSREQVPGGWDPRDPMKVSSRDVRRTTRCSECFSRNKAPLNEPSGVGLHLNTHHVQTESTHKMLLSFSFVFITSSFLLLPLLLLHLFFFSFSLLLFLLLPSPSLFSSLFFFLSSSSPSSSSPPPPSFFSFSSYPRPSGFWGGCCEPPGGLWGSPVVVQPSPGPLIIDSVCVFVYLCVCLPVALCAAGSCRAELGSLAQPPNTATVTEVITEQQRTLAIRWPRLISS